MHKVTMLFPAFVLAGLVGLALAAQQSAPSPSPTTPQSAPAQPTPGTQQDGQTQSGANVATPVQSTAGAPESANEQLRPVTGALEKKIDTKDAKAGDPIVVKTTEDATMAGGTVIPKGSLIIGHVTEVQAHSKENPNAKLTIQFDQAEIKGGQTLPIRTVLESVAPPPTTVHPTDTMNSGMGGAPMAAPGTTGNSGTMAGSPGGSSAPAGAPAAGGAASAPSAGGVPPAMSTGTEQQATNATPETGKVVARQGNVAIKTTAVPGVLLATNANGQPFSNASGALLGAKRNVHLDGGTEVVLAVMDTPQTPGTR